MMNNTPYLICSTIPLFITVIYAILPLLRYGTELYTPIKSVNENNFSFEDFKKDHLIPGIPVIVVASNYPYDNPLLKKKKKKIQNGYIPPSTMYKNVPEDLLNLCGDVKVDLLSDTITSFLAMLSSGPFKILMDYAVLGLSGDTVESWVAKRTNQKLSDLAKQTGWKQPDDRANEDEHITELIQSSMFVRVLRSLPGFRQLIPFIEIVTNPLYLSDIREERLLCAEVTHANSDTPLALSSYEREFLRSFPRDPSDRYARALGGAYGFQANQRTGNQRAQVSSETDRQWEQKLRNGIEEFGDLEIANFLTFDPHTAWFWGGVGSSSYPLHRDLVDADAFFTVLSGCKEFVIIKPNQRQHLHRIDLVPGIPFWSDDVFEGGIPQGVEAHSAWRGVLRPGEMLFLPGDSLHAVRNLCPSTVSICRRSWRASSVRNISKDVQLLFQESEPASIAQRNWLYRIFQSASSASVPFSFMQTLPADRKHVSKHQTTKAGYQRPPPPPSSSSSYTKRSRSAGAYHRLELSESKDTLSYTDTH